MTSPNIPLIAENARLRERVRQLEGLNRILEIAHGQLQRTLDENCAKLDAWQQDYKAVHEIGELRTLRARVAELEREKDDFRRLDDTGYAEITRLRARVAEFADKGTLQALRDANDRTERAESDLDEAREVLKDCWNWCIQCEVKPDWMSDVGAFLKHTAFIDA